MSVFTHRRLAAMRAAAQHALVEDRACGVARFTTALRADDEQVTIAFADGLARIEPGGSAPVDFALHAPSTVWERYFAADGTAQYASIVGLMTAADCTGGVLPSQVASEGDPIRLFANLPILNHILESATDAAGE